MCYVIYAQLRSLRTKVLKHQTEAIIQAMHILVYHSDHSFANPNAPAQLGGVLWLWFRLEVPRSHNCYTISSVEAVKVDHSRVVSSRSNSRVPFYELFARALVHYCQTKTSTSKALPFQSQKTTIEELLESISGDIVVRATLTTNGRSVR